MFLLALVFVRASPARRSLLQRSAFFGRSGGAALGAVLSGWQRFEGCASRFEGWAPRVEAWAPRFDGWAPRFQDWASRFAGQNLEA